MNRGIEEGETVQEEGSNLKQGQEEIRLQLLDFNSLLKCHKMTLRYGLLFC